MEHILPLGSIVHIKTDTQTDYMIVNRAALYQEGKQVGYFDYAAVIYPEGLNANNELTFFNREDITRVLFTGYINQVERELIRDYDQIVADSGYPKLPSH